MGDSRALDCYCCFYWLGHFEGFVAWDFHLVDFLGVELDMSDDLVVCLCSDHEAAIAVYLFRHFSSFADALYVPNKIGRSATPSKLPVHLSVPSTNYSSRSKPDTGVWISESGLTP